MLSTRVIMDVPVLPMLIFNPVVLLMLALALGALIVGVVAAVKRRKTQQEAEQKLKEDLSELTNQDKQEQRP